MSFEPAPEPPTELGRYRILSSTAGVRVSPLQFGALNIGEAWGKGLGAVDKEASFKLLDAYYEAGGNFIDTANAYQNEESETWIGEWMKARKNRDKLFLATKFTSGYRQYVEGQLHAINYGGNHKKSLKMSLRDSLAKLQTDYIDLLYLHWWDWSTSIEEVMDSLDEVVKQGRVLYLGISDTPAYIVSAANEYAKAHGKTQFSVYQGRWNIICRGIEREVIPMCRHYGMAVAPWGAVGNGKFQTKKAVEERKKNNEDLRSFFSGAGQTPDEVEISEVLEGVAKEHNIESVTAVALAYVLSKAPNVFPIVGGRKVEHLYDNIQALKIKLTNAQIEKLEKVVPFVPDFPQDFVGQDPAIDGKQRPLLATTGPLVHVPARKAIGRE